MANPVFYGQITVPTNGWAMNVTGTPKTVAAGTYYIHERNDLTKSLVAKVDDLLNDLHAGNSCTFTETGTNKGRVTIVLSAGPPSQTLTWTATALRDILGFTGNLTAGTNLAPEQAEYVWHPDQPIARALAPIGTLGRRRSDARVTRALDGTVYGTKFNELRENRFLIELVEKERTWAADEVLVNRSWETFWRVVISQVRRFRLVWDEANGVGFANEPAHYVELRPDEPTARWDNDEMVVMTEPPWDARWNIAIGVFEDV